MKDLNDILILEKEHDAYFTIIGKVTYLATDFEADVKTISIFSNLKNSPTILFETDEYEKFIQETLKYTSLASNIQSANYKTGLRDLLTKARKARNELIHTISLGVENLDTDTHSFEGFIQRIKEPVMDILKASCMLKLIIHNGINKEEINLGQDWIEKKYNWIINF